MTITGEWPIALALWMGFFIVDRVFQPKHPAFEVLWIIVTVILIILILGGRIL